MFHRTLKLTLTPSLLLLDPVLCLPLPKHCLWAVLLFFFCSFNLYSELRNWNEDHGPAVYGRWTEAWGAPDHSHAAAAMTRGQARLCSTASCVRGKSWLFLKTQLFKPEPFLFTFSIMIYHKILNTVPMLPAIGPCC